MDGVVATLQCECLEYAIQDQGLKQAKPPAEIAIESNDAIVGAALLICNEHFKTNNETFDVNDGSKYRNIQKDSMRCLLLYISMAIKKFIFDTNSNKDVQPDFVFKYMIRHFKLLKLGVEMLKPSDIHIA